jgi:hypothetical protein
MDGMPASKRAQRLGDIAEKFEVVLEASITPLSPPKKTPSFSIPDDERKADAILGQLRIEESQTKPQPNGLRRAFTKSPKQSIYTYKELYGALSRVIEDDDSPGVAEVLLKRFKAVDGDINFARRSSTGMISKIRSSGNQSEPGRLLQKATKASRHCLVQLLAPNADQENLDESIQIAIQARDLATITTLLQYG